MRDDKRIPLKVYGLFIQRKFLKYNVFERFSSFLMWSPQQHTKSATHVTMLSIIWATHFYTIFEPVFFETHTCRRTVLVPWTFKETRCLENFSVRICFECLLYVRSYFKVTELTSSRKAVFCFLTKKEDNPICRILNAVRVSRRHFLGSQYKYFIWIKAQWCSWDVRTFLAIMLHLILTTTKTKTAAKNGKASPITPLQTTTTPKLTATWNLELKL